MNWIYPVRTGQTLFDYWFLHHFAFWFLVGGVTAPLKIPYHVATLVGLVLALGWEIFERVAEIKWPALWQHPESSLNAYCSDLLTVFVGMAIAYHGYNNWRP